MFIIKNWFLRWEYFNTQITSFCHHFTFLFYIFIFPSKQFYYCTLLTIFEVTTLIDCRMIPYEINWL
jgi:hypothetical protein